MSFLKHTKVTGLSLFLSFLSSLERERERERESIDSSATEFEVRSIKGTQKIPAGKATKNGYTQKIPVQKTMEGKKGHKDFNGEK